MWQNRFARPPSRTIAGVGAAVGVLGLAWLSGWVLNAGSAHSLVAAAVQHPATDTTVEARPIASAPMQPSTPTVAMPDTSLAPLADARFDVPSQPAFVAAEAAAAQPPPPQVAAVDSAPEAAPPAPESMEVSVETDETPAIPPAPPAAPEKTNYFQRGAPSAQHLPIP